MEYAIKAIKLADRILNFFISVLIILALLYAGTSLWDTWQIYNDAGIDSSLLKYKPSTADGGSNPSLQELIAINPDVCGWLTIDGTNIDYPIVQSNNNTEYLNKNVYRDFSLSGSIFLDYRNQSNFSDSYSLLYGHHMDGGAMFGGLDYFLEAGYFKKHQTGTLYLPDATYHLELFACISVDAYDTVVFNPADIEEAKIPHLLDYIEEHAVQWKDITMEAEKKILGLSTCSDAATNGRTVVYGQLTRIRTDN